MIPTVQFDPASLAIWTTTGSLPDPPAAIAAEAMSAAAQGSDPTSALAHLSESDPVRTRMLWLTSSVWHEKRHYFDTCFTNYGARRFRDLFTMAANLLPLLAEANHTGEPVWFPVEVYADPVQRTLLGISQPAANILQIAQFARQIKTFNAQLDAPLRSGDTVLHVGGEAQLEGLAQVSQINSLEHCFGPESVYAVTTAFVSGMLPSGPYRMIESIARSMGCTKKLEQGPVLLNANLAAALFTTALCGRFFGLGPKPASEMVSPSVRLAKMLEALGPRPGRFDMSEEEAAELVDKLALRLWGHTAFEEVAADIDAMDEKIEDISAPWKAGDDLYDAFKDFVKLRRRVLAEARSLGPSSVLPKSFPLSWRDRLLPWHVVASPGGDFQPSKAPIVFGQNLNVPAGMEAVVPTSVTWARLHSASGLHFKKPFAPLARDAWLQMLERHSPGALLMLNGRRHRRMVPPELERSIAEIQALGIDVRFHPRFQWPEQRDNKARTEEAVALAAFSGRTSFLCDITGDEINPADAIVLTPWEFRQSPLLSTYRQSGFIAEVRLITDWSDWVVRRDLLEDLPPTELHALAV
jgi:hypothetical protein